MVSMIELFQHAVQLAAHSLVFADAKDLGDLVGGETKQSQLAGAFEDFVDGEMPPEQLLTASVLISSASGWITGPWCRKLANLLRAGRLSPVYHGECGLRTLQELARSYLTITKDLTRVMNRLKAVFRSWAIPCAGQTLYSPRHRSDWLQKLPEPGVRRRAEQTYEQLDNLMTIRRKARIELLAESRKHPATHLLQGIPRVGPIRAALVIALLQT